MKKKLRKKYSTGGVVNTVPPVTDVQKKKFNTSASNALAYMSSRLDNPEYLKRLSNELVESNKLGNVQYDLTNGAAKQLEQRKKGLKSAKIIQPDTKNPNELAVLNNLQQLGYLGVFDTGKLSRYEPELQTQGFMKGAYAQPTVGYEQSYVGMSPKTLDLSDNVLENLILHEGGGHAIQQVFEGYTNPLFPAGMIPTPQGDKVLYRNKSNLTPYALKTIKDNILSKDEYYSNPDEIMASKLQVEHLFEKAPKGTFKKEWKYGDAIEDEHFDYFLDDKNKYQNLILKKALLGDKKLENLTDDEKKDLKTRFSNIMMKLAQQEQVNPLGIQTAAYGGTIQSNMKNKNIQLPQMGFGGQLAPMLFDIGSNALMNLTGYAVTDLVKAIREPEQERRPTKMNTGFVMANGGMVPNIPVEVEGGEHYEMPNGQIGQFKGPAHENGGIPTALPEGTKVYSDRITKDGKTMSERKSQRERNIAKLEKLLGKNPSDKILKETLKRQKETAALEEQQDMAIQEQVNQQQAQEQMMAGLMQDPAMMQQMGMMMYGGKLGNGTGSSGIPIPNANKLGLDDWSKMYGNVFNPTSNFKNIYYGQAGNDWYLYDKSKPNEGWKLSTNQSGNDWLNKNWITNPKNAYSYHEAVPIPSPEEIQSEIRWDNTLPIEMPRMKSTGLNKTITLNPNERYEGVDEETGFNIIGNQGINNMMPMPRITNTGDNPLATTSINAMTNNLPVTNVTPTGKDGKKQNTLNKLAQALTGSGDKTSTAGGNKDGKAGDKKVNTSPSEYDFTRGDLMGLAGNFIGGIGPMAMTFMNRMMTPPEKNHYREYGAKGMKAIEEGQSMLGSVYNQQKDSIKLGEEASRKRGRASARGVNTMRALDTVADMTSNQAYNQAAANYMSQLLGIFGQKSQQGNLMDQMFMTGEEKKAENILKNLDNFYTNLNEDTSNIATRTMAAGKYLNDAKKNKDLMALSKYYSKYGIGARYGKNGELELYHVNSDKPATETEIKKAEEEIKKENKEEVNPIMPMGFISPYQSYNFGDATMGKISPIRKTKKGSK